MFQQRSSVSVTTRGHHRRHVAPAAPASGRRRRRVTRTEYDESDSEAEQNPDTMTTSRSSKKRRGRVRTQEPDGDPPGPPSGNVRCTKKRRWMHTPESEANYFLIKSDVDVFSIHDLAKCKNQTAAWQGIDSPTAIKTMKKMKRRSLAFFFATNTENPAIVGVVHVTREAYPLKTTAQGDSKKKQYSMDVKLVEIFQAPITLHELLVHSALHDMPLYKKKVTIQTVPDKLWHYIMDHKKAVAQYI